MTAVISVGNLVLEWVTLEAAIGIEPMNMIRLHLTVVAFCLC